MKKGSSQGLLFCEETGETKKRVNTEQQRKRGKEMHITENYLKKTKSIRPGGSYRKTSVTIHSTGNPNSTAKNERAWLDNPTNNRDASWHYVVGESEIIQAIPDTEEAWHCGKGEGNRLSIGIEIAESGDRKKTVENAAWLTASKLKEHGLTVRDIKKHFDWTGKNCPRILIDKAYGRDGIDWEWFLDRVHYYMEGGNSKEEGDTMEKPDKWKVACEEFMREKGLLNSTHEADEKIDMGTLGAIFKNLFDKYEITKK